MEKAQKRAILSIDKEYVFNDIYFGEEGMTSTSANHVSAMANVMVQDIKNRLMGLRLYEKSIRVIGDVECKVEEVNHQVNLGMCRALLCLVVSCSFRPHGL